MTNFNHSDNTNHRLITKLSTVYIFNSLIDSPFSLIMDFKTLNMIELTSNLQFKRIKFASKEHKRICFRFPFQTNKKRKPTSYMMRTTTIIDCKTNKSHNLSNNEWIKKQNPKLGVEELKLFDELSTNLRTEIKLKSNFRTSQNHSLK